MAVGDGAKTVWVQWSDALGNWSAPVSDSITLDQTAPALGTVVIDSGAAVTNAVSRQVSLALTNPGGATNVRIAESVAGLAVGHAAGVCDTNHLHPSRGPRRDPHGLRPVAGSGGQPVHAGQRLHRPGLRKPQGTVAINGGSAGTKSLSVTLTFPNTDTDVDSIEVSNNPNMSGATTFAVTPPFTGSKPWTLSGSLTTGRPSRSTCASTTRVARPATRSPARSTAPTDSIKVDLDRPGRLGDAGDPPGGAASHERASFKLSVAWAAATDSVSGIARYNVWQSVDGAGWVGVGSVDDDQQDRRGGARPHLSLSRPADRRGG